MDPNQFMDKIKELTDRYYGVHSEYVELGAQLHALEAKRENLLVDLAAIKAEEKELTTEMNSNPELKATYMAYLNAMTMKIMN